MGASFWAWLAARFLANLTFLTSLLVIGGGLTNNMTLQLTCVVSTWQLSSTGSCTREWFGRVTWQGGDLMFSKAAHFNWNSTWWAWHRNKLSRICGRLKPSRPTIQWCLRDLRWIRFVVMATSRTGMPARMYKIAALATGRTCTIMTAMRLALFMMAVWWMCAKFRTFWWLSDSFTATW